MSKLKAILEVQHVAGVMQEATVLTPMKCSRCNGRGYFAARDDREMPKHCPDCQGMGLVVASVEIKWLPAPATPFYSKN